MWKRLWTGASVVSVCMVAVVTLVQTRTVTAHAAAPQLIPTPAHWVPFSADFTITRPRQAALTGRFFRAADGSTRRDLTIPGNPPRTRSTIYSASARRVYIGHGLHWRASPSRGYKPPHRILANHGYVKYQWRLALKQGQDGSLKSSVGFTAYSEHYGRHGRKHLLLMVPALNFFVVVSRTSGGYGMTYSNIAIGPQPESLFAPPAGANVVFSSRRRFVHTADSSDEAARAAVHAVYASKAATLTLIHLHLHHVVNCLVGPGGQGFDSSVFNPCRALGHGAIPDATSAAMRTRLRKALATAQAGLASDNPKTAHDDAAKTATTLEKVK